MRFSCSYIFEPTTQGIVGVLKPNARGKLDIDIAPTAKLAIDNIPGNYSNDWIDIESGVDKPVIFKICKYLLNLIDKEYIVAKRLEETVGSILPHFIVCYKKNKAKTLEPKDFKDCKCETLMQEEHGKLKNRIFTTISTAVTKKRTQLKYLYDPFDQDNKRSVARNVIFLEHVKGISYNDFISYFDDNPYKGYGVIESTVQQLMYSLFIAQQKCNFSHRDLHFDNILVQECNERQFFLYYTKYKNFEHLRLVNSFGVMVRMIDYGHSYVDKLEASPILTSLFFSQGFFMPVYADNISDFKHIYLQLAKSRYIRNKYSFNVHKMLRYKKMESDTGYYQRGKHAFGTHLLQACMDSKLRTTTLFSKEYSFDTLDALLLLINSKDVCTDLYMSNNQKWLAQDAPLFTHLKNISNEHSFQKREEKYRELFDYLYDYWIDVEQIVDEEDIREFWIDLINMIRSEETQSTHFHMLLTKYNPSFSKSIVDSQKIILTILDIVAHMTRDITNDILAIRRIEQLIYSALNMNTPLNAMNEFEKAMNIDSNDIKHTFIPGDIVNVFDAVLNKNTSIILQENHVNVLNSCKNSKEQALYIKVRVQS